MARKDRLFGGKEIIDLILAFSVAFRKLSI